jgi:hypothetical protein
MAILRVQPAIASHFRCIFKIRMRRTRETTSTGAVGIAYSRGPEHIMSHTDRTITHVFDASSRDKMR